MHKNFPIKLSSYLVKEFLYSLIIIFVVFLSLSLLINFVEEMSFLKEKKIENLIIKVIILTIYKTPNTLIDLSIFIFLFAGTLFFVKVQKNNEINTILLSGLSKLIPVLAPAFTSFFFGIFIILVVSPFSSSTLKLYEETRRPLSSNENLIVINNTGLWFMETLPDGFNIIRSDRIAGNNFNNLKNMTIYNLDLNFNFIKRIDSKSANIENKKWVLENAKILDTKQIISNSDYKVDNLIFSSTININDLKNYFSNAATVSFWDIANNVRTLNSRGYSADELKLKFHKYLSLPIYLFGTILLATVFTLGIEKNYNTFSYLFFGLIVGFLLYFLNDLSIAIGVSNKLPLIISIWSPVMIIIILSILNLIKIYEK